MMRRALFPALFAAGVTFLLTCLVIGVRLEQDGPNLTVVGADAETWSWIAIAMLAVFLVQLFHGPLSALKQRLPSPDVTGMLPDQQLRARLRPWLIALVVVGLLVWPFMVSRGAVDLATLTLIYVMLGLGLNIVVGFAGLLDLGYVAFYAVGAYTYALLSEYYGLSFWVCLPLAGLIAATFGCILGFPVLRLRGDYLAIVTLGFGEIIRILLNNWTNVTGGPNGIGGIDKPSLFGLEFSRRASEGSQTFHEFFGISYNSSHKVIFLYLVAVLLVLITVYVINRIQRMPIGRAWEALREDEIACRSLGLNPTVIKLSAFTMGASFAGFAGCFFAARQGFISPESFTFIESAIILAIVVLGGMGSQLGVILAAIAMTILPELAREFQEYRMLMFGGVMVLMMLWRPQGLLPMKRPHLELKTS
ncbi:high-affinity branched-chain amino acid ABC transporter permease LivM [Marinobacterium maritimum]|uniref:High-affinity branched-chain amino acid ABC transporter permease LivM n=2 Tax=Marinobacterium maritimum TaxID=500162 RepID=A0ABP3TAB0_9GAMM